MMTARDVLAALRLEDGRRWVDAAEPWQLGDALAVIEAEGTPYHFLTRSRGASKTTDLAAVALALLLSAFDGARLYWLAADQGQGALAIDSIVGFAARTPSIGERLDVQARLVRVPATGAELVVLPADAPGAWGLRPAAVFCDELSWWSDTPAPRRLWEAVSSAVAKTNGRLVVLTTAGDPAHFAAKILEHARRDDLWRVSERPGPAPWMDSARLAEQRARLTPSMFARLFENQWTAADDRLTTPDDLASLVTHTGPLAHQRAHRYVVALDLGLKRDRTAAVVAHREGERVVLDRIAVWQGSRLKPVQLGAVEEWVEQAARGYGGAHVILDPWQTVGLAQRLRSRGLRVEEFAFTAASVGRLAGTLFNVLRDRALSLPDDAELLDELANVRLRETSPGVFRLDHDPGRHDDRAVALALAATHLLSVPQHGPARSLPRGVNPWTNPGSLKRYRELEAQVEREREALERRRNAPPPPEPEPRRIGGFLIHPTSTTRRA